MDKPKRVAVLGFDGTVLPLMQKHIDEGHLPTFKKVIDGGVFAEQCLVPYPTITPPNWATIATGALPGTHNVTDFWLPIKGKTPDSSNVVTAMGSKYVQAETIWDAADKAGKKCIVLNYPTAWPPKMQHGVVVGGAALSTIESIDSVEGRHFRSSVCSNQLITTGIYPKAVRASFEPAEGWANLREPGDDPLELTAKLIFPEAAEPAAPATWHVLARQSEGKGYDTVTLSPTKDVRDAYCTLHLGEWSQKIFTKIEMADGTVREVFFRCKLVELSPDAEDFRLFLTALADTNKLCWPKEVAAKIVSPEGIPVPEAGMFEAMLGLIDHETFRECAELYTRWLADAAVCLLRNGDWDAFFMHSHPPDFTYHLTLTDLDPVTNPSDEQARKKAWDTHLAIYQSQDRLLARILEVLPKDTLVVLVSDHGGVADGAIFDPFKALAPAGLATVTGEATLQAKTDVLSAHYGFNVSKYDKWQSKAIPQRMCSIYVNLKGRDPEGIVEPADYPKVQQEIIDALYTYVDPQTGRRPVALALTKEDARLLGLYGENVGDVVYAVYPCYGSQHGPHLPTARWGLGDMRGLFVLYGPGIKKGVRLQRTVGLQDVVPTICHLTNLPLPEDVDGAVIYQAFKDPDFQRKDLAKLRDGLGRMEAALKRKTREPWDKHDCA